MRKFFWAALFSGTVILSSLAILTGLKQISLSGARDFLAGMFFVESISPENLRSLYSSARAGGGRVKILIVPGHDKETWGTEFRGLRETDLTAEVGEYLAEYLAYDSAFEVSLTRGRDGYAEWFLNYLKNEKKGIQEYRARFKILMEAVDRAGVLDVHDGVGHNNAVESAAFKLHAVNKWAGDRHTSVAVHLHFNDYNRKSRGEAGRYSGYAIYVPESQFSNSRASVAVAKSIAGRLGKYFSESNLPKEDAITEDQELIALTANLDAAALLIEYGYIYEPALVNRSVRPLVLRELAFQTYRGLRDFFRGGAGGADSADTAVLPHDWKTDLSPGWSDNPDVFALQLALRKEGVFPPAGYTARNCPLSGNFGKCTADAVRAFERKYGLSETGKLTAVTRNKLNELYSLCSLIPDPETRKTCVLVR